MTDVLFGLQQEFPRFRIWQEIHGQRKRYVACRLVAGTRPHSVVTADPDELRDVLSGQPCGEERPPAAPATIGPGRSGRGGGREQGVA